MTNYQLLALLVLPTRCCVTSKDAPDVIVGLGCFSRNFYCACAQTVASAENSDIGIIFSDAEFSILWRSECNV